MCVNEGKDLIASRFVIILIVGVHKSVTYARSLILLAL